MKRFKVNIMSVSAIVLTIGVSLILYTNFLKEDKVNYKELLETEKKIHNEDNIRAYETIKYRLENENLSAYERGSNLVVMQTFLFMEGNFDEFEKNLKYIESYLIEHDMDYELVYLYSMVTSVYRKKYGYEKTFIYLYESEIIMNNLYNKNKNSENLSTLLAIKYFKSNVSLEIGLEHEANKTFNEAEDLRKENNIRDRIDIFHSIAIHYCKTNNYEKAKTYALKTIDMAKGHNEYKNFEYRAKIVLAYSYLNTGELHHVDSLLKDIDTNYSPTDDYLAYKYLLYSDVYDFYGYEDKYIYYLEQSYYILKDGNDFARKDAVLDKLIDIYEKIGSEDKLKYLYKEYKTNHDKDYEKRNTQFLIGKVIDEDIINANAKIKILKLEKKNWIYISIISIIALAVVIFIIRKLININKFDPLTNCYNRGYFNKMYKKCNDNKENYSIIIFDLDNFKHLNDTYGHDFGDIVLIKVSKLISNKINKDCKLFRYGGEEFIVLVENKDLSYALDTSEMIRCNIEKMTWREDIKVTVSIGVAYSGDSRENVLKSADINLYTSKNTGKNKVTYKNLTNIKL